jgi:hypothetical protein
MVRIYPVQADEPQVTHETSQVIVGLLSVHCLDSPPWTSAIAFSVRVRKVSLLSTSFAFFFIADLLV